MTLNVNADDVLLCMPCGAKKRAARAHWPLGELYTGPLWSTYRAHRGAFPERNVVLLSALYGLVNIAERMGQAYDVLLGQGDADDLIAAGVMCRGPAWSAPLGSPVGAPFVEIARGRFQPLDSTPFRAVIIAGAGGYGRVFAAYVAELQRQAPNIIAADAAILKVAGGIGTQRGQLGQWLREINQAQAVAA